MEWILWPLGAVALIIAIVLITSYVCYRIVFRSPKKKKLGPNEYEIPKGEIYEVFREQMISWIKDVRSMPHENASITSHDGLTLRAKYYEYKKGATTELMFHGYQGNAERDLCGAVERAFALGRNALIINHRGSGDSDGKIITFGIKERLDCRAWIDFATKKFGKDVKLMITGISMGAATVMMTAGEELPKNVVCVLADCGYTSAEEIIKKVLDDMKLPKAIFYPFIKLGARLYAGFNLEEYSPIEAMKKCKTPIIFVHGDNDRFVPYEMSKRLYEICAADQKEFITINGAGHGLAYPVDKEGYISRLREIDEKWNLAS